MKKGFTLVELIAVIILLGLIIALTIPNYNKYVEKGKYDSFKETLNGLNRTLEIYVTENIADYSLSTNIIPLELKAENIETIKSGQFKLEDNKIKLIDITNGSYCGNGTTGNHPTEGEILKFRDRKSVV